jgi:tetratricopeptide (TPR) repeat protein
VSVSNARLLAVLVLCTGASERAWPQTPLLLDVRGEVQLPPATLQHGYTIHLYDMNLHLETVHADIDMSGDFKLRGVTAGDYAVRIRDESGQLLCEEYLTLGERNPPLRFNISKEQPRQRPAGATISVRQLQHPPSSKAVQSFLTALRFSEAKQYEKAAEELEKAVRLSPEFAEAYTNLAAQHFRMGRFAESAAESRRAMELSSPNPRDLCNLALALWGLGLEAEALDEGKKALALDSSFASAHFVVGILLTRNPATQAEGIRHLERASPTMPSAAAALAQLR